MAKRFVESGLFRKPFVRGLKGPYKILFVYYITECDHAGVWDMSNLDIDSILLNEELTINGVKEAFSQKAIFVDGKMFMPDFIKTQYGSLNESNRVHKSVITRLRSLSICEKTLDPSEGHTRPFQGCKDKDKVKDKDKEGEGLKFVGEEKIESATSGQTFPTLDQIKKFAKSQAVIIQPDCAETFWNDSEAAGWVDKFNRPVRSWQAALRAYASRWNQFSQRSGNGQTPKHHKTEYVKAL